MPHYLYTPITPFDSTLPNLIISVQEGKVVGLEWENDSHQGVVFLGCLSLSCADCVLIFRVTKQLDEYFLGKRIHFDLPLQFVTGTDFQQKVWHELTKIEYGTTISYKELAVLLNKPTAYRAVANANGKNPISLIVPCHRVIASNGGIGGYTGGIEIKEILLGIETQSS